MENASIHFRNRAEKYNRSSNWVADQELIRLMFDLSGAGPESEVLDIATGTGLIAREFHGKVKRVTGLDISPEMAAQAEGCVDELVFAPVEQMPFPDNSFDVVVCRQGLQFAELDRAIPEIYRVLKPGGSLAVVEFEKVEGPPGPPRAIRLAPPELDCVLAPHGFRLCTTTTLGPYAYLSVYASPP